MQAIPLKRVVAHKHHLMQLQPYAGNVCHAGPYAVVSSRAPVAPLFSEHAKNAAQQDLQLTSVMKALEDDHTSKLMAIINSSKIAQMPKCMERCTPFKDTSPHCVWCPAAEGPQSEDGNQNECIRPCRRAFTRDIQDMVVAARMLQDGWIATDSRAIALPDNLRKENIRRDLYHQSYRKVAEEVLGRGAFNERRKKQNPRKAKNIRKNRIVVENCACNCCKL